MQEFAKKVENVGAHYDNQDCQQFDDAALLNVAGGGLRISASVAPFLERWFDSTGAPELQRLRCQGCERLSPLGVRDAVRRSPHLQERMLSEQGSRSPKHQLLPPSS